MIIKNINSLTRVFGKTDPGGELLFATMLLNDLYNYQVAICPENDMFLKFMIESDIDEAVTVRNIFSVPSEFEIYSDAETETGYEFSPDKTYPDVLSPAENHVVFAKKDAWCSLWISIDSSNLLPGRHYIRLIFLNPQTHEKVAESEKLELEVLPVILDPQTLIYTNWLHCDCLSHYYNEPVFSEKFWEILESYIKTAADHGMNMLLTPIFTPPLDTAAGTERLTVQLVSVKKKEGGYLFDFDKLGRWIDTAKRCGIEYFEISHLFTQWGVASCPKIIADVNGEERCIFGWDTDADSPEYTNFLNMFLPELTDFLRKKGVAGNTYFHISDEPAAQFIERYRFASDLIKKHLGAEFRTFDALSDYEFYENGLVETPIPSTNAIEAFRDVKELWTYYCCAQYHNGLSNRFFCMPSFRNRVIGVQLYIYNVKGFLHWGYNFYNTQNSFEKINPYLVTAAGATFPSGDAFVVYPASDGSAIPSLRFEVFADALRDLRALQTLEKFLGRETVLQTIHEGLDYKITMSKYPQNGEWLLSLRAKINSFLEKTAETSSK